MRLRHFIQGQTRQAIERPVGSAIMPILFGFITGMQTPRLIDSWCNLGTVRVSDYVFALVFALLTVWYAFVAARAIRQIQGGHESAAREVT